jgi:hypothetical protein
MSLVPANTQVHPETVKRLGIYDLRHRNQPWYDAYMAALFEPDSHEALQKLRSAEKLMTEREREIHNNTAAIAERSALERAFDALRALRMCLKL